MRALPDLYFKFVELVNYLVCMTYILMLDKLHSNRLCITCEIFALTLLVDPHQIHIAVWDYNILTTKYTLTTKLAISIERSKCPPVIMSSKGARKGSTTCCLEAMKHIIWKLAKFYFLERRRRRMTTQTYLEITWDQDMLDNIISLVTKRANSRVWQATLRKMFFCPASIYYSLQELFQICFHGANLVPMKKHHANALAVRWMWLPMGSALARVWFLSRSIWMSHRGHFSRGDRVCLPGIDSYLDQFGCCTGDIFPEGNECVVWGVRSPGFGSCLVQSRCRTGDISPKGTEFARWVVCPCRFDSCLDRFGCRTGDISPEGTECVVC